MSSPVIAAKRPSVSELVPGTYYWWRCGRSSNQPFCDGSHHGSEFEPLRFEIKEPTKVALCQCKRTGNPPYCDGTHNSLT